MDWFKYVGLPLIALFVLWYTGHLNSPTDVVLLILASVFVSLFFWHKDRYNSTGVGSSLTSVIDFHITSFSESIIRSYWKSILFFFFIFFLVSLSSGFNVYSLVYSIIAFTIFSLLYSELQKQSNFTRDFTSSDYSASCLSCGYSYHRRSSQSYLCPRCGSRNVANK